MLYDESQIVFSTLSYTKKKGISKLDFDEAIINRVLYTTCQCGVFVFTEKYHAKVLHDVGGLTVMNYYDLDRQK